MKDLLGEIYVGIGRLLGLLLKIVVFQKSVENILSRWGEQADGLYLILFLRGNGLYLQ